MNHDKPGGWLDRLRRRLFGDRDARLLAAPQQQKRPAKRQWVLLESVHSAALGSLHQQVLDREGIPVMLREWGGGSAVLGGVPVGVSVFVPDDRVDEALAVLGLDSATEGRHHER